MTPRSSIGRGAAMLLGVALFAAACGGSDGTSVTEPPAETPTPAVPTSEPLAPTVAVAVVDVSLGGWLNVRTQPGASNDLLGQLDPWRIGIRHYVGEVATVDGVDWFLIGNPMSRDFDGWVSTEYVVDVEGESDQTFEFYEAASGARGALLAENPAEALASLLEQQGVAALTISVDGFFSPDDPALSPGQIRETGATYLWGQQDGSGEPINQTVGETITTFATTAQLSIAPRIAVNTRLQPGNTLDNAREFFPGATIVEIHNPGTGESADFNWSTVRLVFVNNALVGMALDTWTI